MDINICLFKQSINSSDTFRIEQKNTLGVHVER